MALKHPASHIHRGIQTFTIEAGPTSQDTESFKFQ